MKALTFPLHVFSLLVILIFLTGCETTALESKAPPPDAIEIKRGAPVATLIEQMGEPYQKSTIEKSGSTGDVWSYRHQMRSKSRMVITDTQEVPFYDREQNETIIIRKPVLSQEISYVTQITKFLIMDGRVISWKQQIVNEHTSFE